MQDIAKLIDHTLLKPTATSNEIRTLCTEALEYSFYSVCIHPFFIKTARQVLQGSEVRVATVIGFPLGMSLRDVKISEAMESVASGADELDMVLNIGKVKEHNWDYVRREISGLVTATPRSVHKVIIEACCLSDDEKVNASLSALDAGAEFVKTSTGFAASGAVLRDVELIRTATKGRIGIKAAGGIKTLNDLLTFVKAGASRIGTSSGVEIMKEKH
ncbi:MAG: deoxyribose-phosphate aldolase [Nitrospirae bacterium]|nr:deoxyribose-phosphate aldolase [Nitrospirota bacterium]